MACLTTPSTKASSSAGGIDWPGARQGAGAWAEAGAAAASRAPANQPTIRVLRMILSQGKIIPSVSNTNGIIRTNGQAAQPQAPKDPGEPDRGDPGARRGARLCGRYARRGGGPRGRHQRRDLF